MFAKSDRVGKVYGFEGTFEPRLGPSLDIRKNTWLIDSSVSLHLAHGMSLCIPLTHRFFFTEIHPDTIFH